MQTPTLLRAIFSRGLKYAITVFLFAQLSIFSFAASIRGMITDTTGAKIRGANIALFSNGVAVSSAISSGDGSFQLFSGSSGRFFLVVSANSFRQLQTPDFYAGQFDAVERNIVLEPAWVRESIVVTATGAPTPQSQTSAATTVLSALDLALRSDFINILQLMPGTFPVQTGQRGAQSSLFIRGGNPGNNKILIDGNDVSDLGGQFDFGPLSTTGVESAEIYRGPNSSLYGANASSGVIRLTTPHGTTSFPSILIEGDAGNLSTSREQLQIAGSRGKLDYLGAYSWFQTANSLPRDSYHVSTITANVGWQPSADTQIRGTLHYGVDATGVPNAWDFFQVADDATQKDQRLFFSGSIDHQTTPSLHQSVNYGLTHKREQYNLWSVSGSGDFDAYGDTLGKRVTIAGANGYSVTGQAILDGPSPYGDDLVSNRDRLTYQADDRITPHLFALIGFHFENERGMEKIPSYGTYENADRTNYNYIAAVHGDFKGRFFYSLSGNLAHYQLFGTQTSPRAGVSFFALRPRSGVFSGTRILFNYGDAVREPKLTDEFGSLYKFLLKHGGDSTIGQFHITPLAAPTTRTYEGGFEQSFLSQHIIFRASYFHNQFGRELESVGASLVPALLPDLTAAQQTQLEQFLTSNLAYSLVLNTQAYRAQGAETSVESGIGKNLFLRGGYTYLDAVVQRSFTSDNQALLGGYAPAFSGIPIGAYSPLVGARPFRRPPHTGFFTTTWTPGSLTFLFNSSFASRSDDSTYLSDAQFGSTLLLPNRNLNHGYARIDLGGSYQLLKWMDVYTMAENLLDNQHMAPIGYPSLPFTIRTGLRLRWGPGSGR